MDLSKLKEPFPPDRVSWRVGSTNADKSRGMALAYIDARDVQDRLDTVCGTAWQCRYALLGVTTVCEIGIRIGDEWVWRADGAGATDFEGEKGALSDAFKRAAVKWGIGRYLYDVDAPWVAIEGAGKSFKIKADEMAKLRAALTGKPPAWANAARPADTVAAEGMDNRATVLKFGSEALLFLKRVKNGGEFETWHRESRDKIAAVKDYDADLHRTILQGVDWCKTNLMVPG
jgi:hypothetical protein